MPPVKAQTQPKTRSSSIQESPAPRKVPSSGDNLNPLEKDKQGKLETEGAVERNLDSMDEENTGTYTVREEIKSLFEKMDRKMTKQLKDMESKFAHFFDNFRQELIAIKSDMGESKEKLASLNTKVDEIEKCLEFQSKEQKDIEKKQDEKLIKTQQELDQRIKELDTKLLLLEKHDRKYNLIFYGIKEEASENIYEKVRDLLITNLEMDEEKVQNMYFANAHRLPSYGKEGPRPFIVRFTSFEEREQVLSLASKLVGSRKRIVTDLPVQMKKERARIARVAYDIRKKEKLQTRIREKGLQVSLEVRRDSLSAWAPREV